MARDLFRDVRPCWRDRSSPSVQVEVMAVTNDRVLGEVVHAWVQMQHPADPGAADGASARARAAYRDGASMSEACEEAMEFVGSWVRHPSHWSERVELVALAS